VKIKEKEDIDVENHIQPEVFIDMDVIPSLEIVNPTMVEEREPTTEAMDVDPRVREKNPIEVQNHMQ
jgi:hypothetical protein